MTWDELNNSQGNAPVAPIKSATPTKGGWDALNASFTDEEKNKKADAESQAMMEKAINAGNSPYKLSGPTTISATPEPKPPSWWQKPFIAVKDVIVNTITDKRIGDLVEATDSRKTIAERAGKMISGAVGVGNLAFLPVTAQFAAAEALPGPLALPAKAIGYGFGKLGEAGLFVGAELIDNLPISNEVKDALKTPVSELFALATQAIVGGKLLKKGTEALTTPAKGLPAKIVKGTLQTGMALTQPVTTAIGLVKAGFVSKVATRQAEGIEITPQEGQKIINEIAKEVPIETPDTIIKFPNDEGSIQVHTTKRAVLENFLKGQEDINYKIAKSLGVDTEGNKITARFEWDYKRQEATIYTTKATTASNLAQELGHYFDTKLVEDVNTKMSDILGDYKTNKDQINSSLTKYAVDQLKGNATPKQITSTIKGLVDKFNQDIGKLAVTETRAKASEKFASAVREVIMNPNKAAQTAPSFTNFIQYFAKKKGFIGEKVKKVVETVKVSEVKEKTIKESTINEFSRLQEYATKQEKTPTGKKGVALDFSGIKRSIEGKPTTIEFNNAKKYLESNYRGKKVVVNGKKGIITKPSFGKIGVRFEDGTIKFFDKVKIKTEKVTFQNVINHIKDSGSKKLEGKKQIYGGFKTEKPITISRVGEEAEIQKMREAKTGQPITINGYSAIKDGRDSGFFTPENFIAEGYGGMKGGETKSVVRTLKNPYVADTKFEVINYLKKKYPTETQRVEDQTLKNEKDYFEKTGKRASTPETEMARDAFVKEKLSAEGYDGVIYNNYSFMEGQVFNAGKIEKTAEEYVANKTAKLRVAEDLNKVEIPKIESKVSPRGNQGGKNGVVRGQIGATGLKTGKFVENRVAFNPDKINAPKDVEDLIKGVAKATEEFKQQRISKSNEDIDALAREVGVSADDLIKTQPGSIANAETVFKARKIVADLASDLRDTIRSITTETATKEQLQEVKTKLFRLQGTMKAVAGFRTEASHIFRQFQMEALAGENDIMTELVSQLKKLDGKAGNDLEAFTKGSKKLVEATMRDKLWHLWYMSILSGESTQIKNIAGNMTQMAGEVVVEAIVNPKGFVNSMQGLWEGLMSGNKEFTRIMKKGDISKFEEKGIKPIKFTLGWEKGGNFVMPRKIGAAFLNSFDYVGRFMSGMDVWARAGFKGLEISALAREQAIKEGLKGEALTNRIAELRDKPLDEMITQADAFGARGTYTQKPTGILGILSEFMGRAARKIPGGKFVLPFTRIVANVVNNSLDWTPVGLKRALVKPVKIGKATIFKEGGFFGEFNPETLKPRATKQALARAAIGTVAMGFLASLATNNQLSGNGPSNFNHKKQLQDTGWRPNSIKIGNTWYPYQNWGPMAIPMTLVGNYFDFTKYEQQNADASQRAMAALLNTPNSILDMSFLSGTAGLVNAIQTIGAGGENYIKRFVASQITSVVPNLVKQTIRYFDPGVYETKTLKTMILSNLRITSGLKPSLNVFGQPIKGEALTQLQPVKETYDKTIQFLAKNELWVTVPNKTTKVRPISERSKLPKGGRPMTEDEYYNYVKYSGIEIKKRLDQKLMMLERLSPEKQQKTIDQIVSDIRDGTKKGIEMGLIK